MTWCHTRPKGKSSTRRSGEPQLALLEAAGDFLLFLLSFSQSPRLRHEILY